jgi:cellulose synthase/poly-beta-1,6-N-acetylglucosamine synthase-like glycosyltransferase/GGDEF domain-containing protein
VTTSELAQHTTTARRRRTSAAVASLLIGERERIASRFGRSGLDALLAQVGTCLTPRLRHGEAVRRGQGDALTLLLEGDDEAELRVRLDGMVHALTRAPFDIGPERVHITPVMGWAAADAGDGRVDTLFDRAAEAAHVAADHLDLVPRRWTAGARRPARPRRVGPGATTLLQVLLTGLVGVVLPFALLMAGRGWGMDLAVPAYVCAVAALVITSGAVWLEGLAARRPAEPPAEPATSYPPASAIIPAYLPNEAATIMETVRAFLRVDYPGRLQVVVAYNTPHELPVEADLRRLAAVDSRVVVLRVPHSSSKAQNVNAALQMVTGAFTAIYDADHHPEPDAFRRAWRWLSHGADVVQGHCVIRNGAASWVARTVAVEFESIYAVSHPGRGRLHGFGLFCGSNGFWRTSLLRQIRMRSEMLTEDIDSSIRVLLRGRRLVNDPALRSRELAPATLGALWHQRIRWAQGWFQVSRRYLGVGLRSPALGVRGKLGLLFLLGWREIHPWLSLQIIPVLAYLVWRDGVGGVGAWLPVCVLTSLWALSVGPGQVLLAYCLGDAQVRRHRWWFLAYLAVSMLFYTELKNLIARTAHLKELTGERRWIVTPRAAARPLLKRAA